MHTGDRSGGGHRRWRHVLARLRRHPGPGRLPRLRSTSPDARTPGAPRTCCATSRACTTPGRTPSNGPRRWPALLLWGPRRRGRRPRCDQAALDGPPSWTSLVTRYRRARRRRAQAASRFRHGATARDADRLARQFLHYEDMILRFATRPDLDIFTNNEAERTIRARQGPAAQLRRMLAHHRRARRLRRRPVLPVHRQPNGASASSTPSAPCSTATRGYHPASNQPHNTRSTRSPRCKPLTLAE